MTGKPELRLQEGTVSVETVNGLALPTPMAGPPKPQSRQR